jgi:microcystin-dependent protein
MSNYIDRVWAENGDVSDVPIDAQGDGSVSLEQGWTELYDRNVITDPTALSLSRGKTNGTLKKITYNVKQWLDQCYPDYYQFDNRGNPVEYKIYSAVRYNNGVYLSKVNNNTALPTDATKWSLFQTLDFASEAEAIARTETNKWMNPFVSGKLIDNELVSNIPKRAIDLLDTDLNSLSSLSDAGFYFQKISANTAGNNYPVNQAGSLLVSRSAGGVSQTYTVFGASEYANRIYTRGNYLGVWSGWRDISGGTDTLNPVGSIIMLASSSVPDGYLICNGASISRTTYASLFAKIGIIYGAGNSSTTYNLPDLRGEFIRGWDDGRGVDTGRLIGSHQMDGIKEHYHNLKFNTRASASETDGTGAIASSSVALGRNIVDGDTFHRTLIGAPPYQELLGAVADTRPRNVAMMYCIKY